jgi:hypothetical protein
MLIILWMLAIWVGFVVLMKWPWIFRADWRRREGDE